MIAQRLPFQCSTNVLVRGLDQLPTAKQLVVLGHDTPFRVAYVNPIGLRLCMISQLPPFQRSTRLSVVPL